MENMEENCEKVWKYRRKVSGIVKWYGHYGWNVSWIVKWYGKYRRTLWKDMKNIEKKQVE